MFYKKLLYNVCQNSFTITKTYKYIQSLLAMYKYFFQDTYDLVLDQNHCIIFLQQDDGINPSHAE